jgi:hypothetical protein
MVLLKGLLAQQPQCPSGHGAMEEQPGVWAVDQVNYNPAGQGWDRTGTFYACKLYRCNTCGLIQLYDHSGR